MPRGKCNTHFCAYIPCHVNLIKLDPSLFSVKLSFARKIGLACTISMHCWTWQHVLFRNHRTKWMANGNGRSNIWESFMIGVRHHAFQWDFFAEDLAQPNCAINTKVGTCDPSGRQEDPWHLYYAFPWHFQVLFTAWSERSCMKIRVAVISFLRLSTEGYFKVAMPFRNRHKDFFWQFARHIRTNTAVPKTKQFLRIWALSIYMSIMEATISMTLTLTVHICPFSFKFMDF